MIDNPVPFKQCKKCLEWKMLDHFHNDKARKDGKYPNCKQCTYAYMRGRYKNQPELRERLSRENKFKRLTSKSYRDAAKLRGEKFYASIHGRAKTLLKGARSRQPECSVTLEHITNLLERGICPVTGYKFDLINGIRATGKTYHPFAPSLDKITPSLGYTNQNTRLVIWQYNVMKGEQTDSLILEICKAIVDKNK